MAPKNVTFKSKPLHGAKGRLAALWSVTFPTGVNKSFIQWNETEWNAPFLTEARNACETSIPMIFIWMLRKWMNWTPSYFTGTLHTLWSLHKIYHVNVTYMNGYSNERCYHLWRNKCGHKWTLALWYMMSLQPGEIDQVSSIKIIIIILSTLFNSSQPFNSVFSQLILITLLLFLELPLTNSCSAHHCTDICLVLHSLLPSFLQLFQRATWLFYPVGPDKESMIRITSEKQIVV